MQASTALQRWRQAHGVIVSDSSTETASAVAINKRRLPDRSPIVLFEPAGVQVLRSTPVANMIPSPHQLQDEQAIAKLGGMA
jgi:hypothetical protein